jgi:hypothetical protein
MSEDDDNHEMHSIPSEAFKDYIDDSQLINGFLLNGDKFLENSLRKHIENREEKIQIKKKQLIDQIKYMDDRFLNHLERNETDGLVVYRGVEMIDFRMKDMTKPSLAPREDWYAKSVVLERNEPIEVLNFVSTSTSIDIAEKFVWHNRCCLYELHIQKGIPIMEIKGGFRNEKEILLPRNLLFQYVETKHVEDFGDVIVMNVIMKNKNQFNPLVEESKRNEITALKTTKPPEPVVMVLRRSERLMNKRIKADSGRSRKSSRKLNKMKTKSKKTKSKTKSKTKTKTTTKRRKFPRLSPRFY